jgi:UDP-N-acetylmuramate--alanine ligase
MFGINKELKIHFIGIGGIGMSGIAEVLHNLGYQISGSDLSVNANVEKLKEKGIEVFKGHHKKNISDVQLVVYSSAVTFDNPEIIEAKNNKIPIVKRAEMLAELMRLKYGIAIAGSHGKTTTTSFVSTIFKKMNKKPTCIVGGIVKNLGAQALKGDSEYLIAEADESDGSFLYLNPIMSVITNIDNDHLDYYQNEENIKKAFVEFSNKIPFYGCISINANDKNSAQIIKNIRRPYITYAINTKEIYIDEVDYLAKNIVHKEQASYFTLQHENKEFTVEITLSGDHNIQNALAAISVSHQVGLELKDICEAISSFEGVGRRFESLYSDDNLVIIDDYGHHPTEIRATINTAKVKYKDRKFIAIFEPHRFTRTKEFWQEFVDSFEGIDEVYIAPIYAASEVPIQYIDSEVLVKNIREKYNNAFYLSRWDDVIEIIEKNKQDKTVIVSMGAGSISRIMREKVTEWINSKS